MKKLYLLCLLSIFGFSQTSYYLPGFSIYPYFNEQVKVINYNPEVRIFINAPSPQNFDPTKRVGLALFALPNGNTIEHTIGKILKTGDDWHYDIQHIGAQTRFLRAMNLDYNLVTVYLETTQKSWPSWRSKYSNNATIIKNIVDSLRNLFSQYNPYVILTGHSGGGSFSFGFMNAYSSIPSFVERITFLDSDYNYDNTYGAKLINWLNASTNNHLCVIAYNDSIALYNGQPIVSPTGGTWYRSRMMATYMAGFFTITTEEDSSFIKYTGLNGRVKFVLKHNPLRQILHTVQVELNGFIHGLLTGTNKENNGYVYYGTRAYTPLIQNDIIFPTPLNIPLRQPSAKTGSQFMQYVTNMTVAQRESEIYNEISSGNIPNFLRQLRKITSTFNDLNGSQHSVIYEVMPDYLAIGSDSDYCRIPMGPKTAQRLADLFGAVMPTTKLVDNIYQNCEIKLAPVTYTPVGNQNELVPKFILHNTAIDSQRILAGGQLGQLTGGTKKDVVLSNKIIDPTKPNHVCIYGWHQLNGTPIQPLTNIHIDSYVDYSHGIRFLNKEIIMDGTIKQVPNILKDAVLYKVLSTETEPMTQPSYFKDTTLPNTPKSFGVKTETINSLRLYVKNDTNTTTYTIQYTKNPSSFKDSITLSKNNLLITDLEKDSVYYIKIKANNEMGSSAYSEVIAGIPTSTNPNVLLVHGFDRASTGNTKDFIKYHAKSIQTALRKFNSCTNDAVLDGLFNLNNYSFVDYILGDESTVDETFSTAEQNLVKSFLQNGGNLLATGAEIAWDLDNKGATTDKSFFYDYLKSRYIADAPNGQAGVYYQAVGLESTPLSTIPQFYFDNGTHGTINVSYPDVVKGTNGGIPFLNYVGFDTSYGSAGIYFSGLFSGGSKNGRVVFLGFPIESIYTESTRNLLFQKILEFFEIPTLIICNENLPTQFSLKQNYPNPFNASTKIEFSIPNKSNVKLLIFNINGELLDTVLDKDLESGNYFVNVSLPNFSSGIYFYKLIANNYQNVKKLCLVK